MSVTAWLLVALLVATSALVVAAALDLADDDRRLPRRPVPLPRRRPDVRPEQPAEFTAPLLTERSRTTDET